ncbi:MAG: ribbon-helix-helix protein, CopG family [Prochloraceae cyanobacterium]
MSQAKRVNFRLSETTVRALEKIATEKGLNTLTEALRQAIATEVYLLEAKKRGAKILLEEGDSLKELVFR